MYSIINNEGSIEILSANGAEYLRFKRPGLEFNKEDLHTVHGDIIKVGDKIIGLGIKLRTAFHLKEPYYMEYEGTFQMHGRSEVKYAVFNCTAHNTDPEADWIYRYVFSIVETPEGKIDRFLIGIKAMRDVSLKPIHRYEK